MNSIAEPSKRYSIIGGLSGVIGVAMIVTSFAINPAPPPGLSAADLVSFASQHSHSVLVGAWLQAVGPVLITLFAFVLVHLGRASSTLAGWMTFFGASVLMMVSLIEITFYISALDVALPPVTMVSLELIHSVQHLYFIVAAPCLFLPLAVVLLRSQMLPKVFSYSAFLLGGGFAVVGILSLFTHTLSPRVTALGSLQGVWWLAAATTLTIRTFLIAGAIPAPGDN